MNATFAAIASLVCSLAFSACGGGGAPSPSLEETLAALDYTPPAQTRYTYAPYETPSARWLRPINETTQEILIGGDWEPAAPFREAFRANGMTFALGTVRDGAGVERLQNYQHDLITQDDTTLAAVSDKGFRPFTRQPLLYVDAAFQDPENRELFDTLARSIVILNDALPPEFQIVIAGQDDPPVSLEWGDIAVRVDPAGTLPCGTGAVACATEYRFVGREEAYSAAIYLPDDLATTGVWYQHTTIIHELLHALGIRGHVDSIEFPDSLLGQYGEYFPTSSHLLSRIDREVLQIMYMSQLTTQYNDWGEWSDTSFHLVGRSDDEALNFGVALFNGLPHPWVRGVYPQRDLADNPQLYGTATWSGRLLGFSGPSPLAGDAELEVRLATVGQDGAEHDLRFRDLFFVNQMENPDLSPTSDRWFDTRNIDYKVTIDGNLFLNVQEEGYEEGWVTGSFLGEQHEHMGGTVKRTDLVGAFGGSRP